MNNLFFGIITILFCAIGYFFSWRLTTKRNYKAAVLLIVICGIALRIFISSDFYLHTWDERYHALVAKNLINHPLTPTLYDNPILPFDFRHWTANHIWVHKQPLPLWAMAFSMWVFGVNEIALRLPSIIFSCIGIWFMFLIGNYFYNKRVGYLAAFFYSINGLILELTSGRVATDHIDISFLFFIQLSIVFCIQFAQTKKSLYNILIGVCIGAAILTKWLPALIVLPIWLLIVMDTQKFKTMEIVFHFFILITTCVLIIIPWQLYIYKSFPEEAAWESSFNFKHFTQVLENNGGPFYYYLNKIRINYGELIYLPLLWFLWQVFFKIKDKKIWALLIWFFIPLLFFSLAKTKMQGYILFTCPVIFLITAAFYFMLTAYKANHKFRWFFNVLLFLLIALPIRYSIERVKPFDKGERAPKWVTELKDLNSKQIEKGILFNYNKPIEAMFYTNLTVYPYLPDSTIINNLIDKGYVVLINDNGQPLPIRKTNDHATILHLTELE